MRSLVMVMYMAMLAAMALLAVLSWNKATLLLQVAAPAFAMVTCIRLRTPRGPIFSALLPLLALGFVVESIGLYTSSFGIHNTSMFNAYVVAEFLLVLRLVAVAWPGPKWPLVLTALLGIAAVTWSWSRWRSLDFLLTEGVSVMALLLCGWMLVLLWRLSEHSMVALSKVPSFWVFTGLLLYFGALFPVIGPLRYLYSDHPALTFYLYSIVQALSVVRYGMIGYGCILEARTRP